MSGFRLPQPQAERRQPSDDASWQHQHQSDKNHAKQKLPIFSRGHRVGLQIGEYDAADDRASKVAEAAEQRREHDLAREGPVKDVGCRQAVKRHPENTREPRDRSGDDKGYPAESADAQAEKARADLVISYGLKRLAERRVHDHPHQDDAYDEDGQYVVVVGRDELLEAAAAGEIEQAQQQRRTGYPQTVAAAGHPIELQRQAVDHLRKRQRQNAEEDSGMPDADIAEQRRYDRDNRKPDQDVELHGMQTEALHHEGNAVGADAEIGGMTE